MRQLPGLASQNMMADGIGYGARATGRSPA